MRRGKGKTARAKVGDVVYARLAMWHTDAMPKGTLVRGVAVDPPWPAGLVLVGLAARKGERAWCRADSVLYARRAS